MFSLVTIVKNAETTLPYLIKSAELFLKSGGEYVVVDTGSTDRTKEIGQAAGAKVVEVGAKFMKTITKNQIKKLQKRYGQNYVPPESNMFFDFGQAREFASTCASNDWVFHVDASDTLDQFDFVKIQQRIREEKDATIKQYGYMYRYGETDPSKRPEEQTANITTHSAYRFYHRGFYEWKGSCHEVLCKRPNVEVNNQHHLLDRSLLGVSHHKQRKTRNYLAALWSCHIDDVQCARWAFYLGRELWYTNNYRSAIRIMEHMLSIQEKYPFWQERNAGCCVIARCHLALSEPEKARKACWQAIELCGTRREPWIILMESFYEHKMYHQCMSAANAADAVALDEATSLDEKPADYTYIPKHFNYWCLENLGRRSEAKAAFLACKHCLPANIVARDEPTFNT